MLGYKIFHHLPNVTAANTDGEQLDKRIEELFFPRLKREMRPQRSAAREWTRENASDFVRGSKDKNWNCRNSNGPDNVLRETKATRPGKGCNKLKATESLFEFVSGKFFRERRRPVKIRSVETSLKHHRWMDQVAPWFTAKKLKLNAQRRRAIRESELEEL